MRRVAPRVWWAGVVVAVCTAPLILACRGGENAAAVQRFIDLVQSTADQIDAVDGSTE